MKVFLGNAPWSDPPFYGVRAGSRWPHLEDSRTSDYMPFPFFLAYAAALLEREGHEVLLIDAIAEGIDRGAFLGRLAAFAPAVMLLEVSTPSFATDLAVLAAVRERVGREPILALAGIHEEMYHPAFLTAHPEVDWVLRGEYEATLAEAVRVCGGGGKLDGVAGMVVRDGDGVVVRTAERPLISDLDSLPRPARHFLPMDRYHDEPGGIPRPSLQVWSSRGCPFRCSFCAWPQILYGGNAYRVRSPGDFADEVAHATQREGYRSFYADDDTFNVGTRRMLEIAAALRERGVQAPWAMMARADTCDLEAYEALRDAGMTALKIGVESGDPTVLERCGKRLDLARVRVTVGQLKAMGIRIHLTFTFGLPGETRDSARRTRDLALELDPFSLQFSIATPFPGSRYHREVVSAGHLVTRDTRRYDGFHESVVRTEALEAEEIRALHQEACRAWAAHTRRRDPRGGRWRQVVTDPIGSARKAIRRLVRVRG